MKINSIKFKYTIWIRFLISYLEYSNSQEVLNAEGGPGESLGMMYGTLLRNYEAVKEDYSLIRKRYDDLVSSHSAAVNKLEHSQVRSIVT